jgi:threonine-phosphate decarboxylase
MEPDALDDLSRVPHGGTRAPDAIDFSANTNPETPSGITAVYDSALAASRRYPADDYAAFRAAAADYVDCAPAEVIPTAGVMAGIRLAFSAIVCPGDSAVIPAPSFGEYAREIRLQGGDPVPVAHDAVVDVDPTDHALVVVCTPNNPTGELADETALRDLAARCRDAETTLFVDEAFLDYTAADSLAGEPGVVVARSLTKVFGFPGLRVGFLVATGDIRDRLDAARLPWGVSTPAAAVGTHCLQQSAFVEATRDRVVAERDRLRERLSARWTVFPSDAPFLLVDVGEDDPDEVLATARERGIVLRDARTFSTLDNHFRAAVRRPRENDRLLDALDA